VGQGQKPLLLKCRVTRQITLRKLGKISCKSEGNFANKFNKSIRRFPLQKPQTPTLLGKINGISGLITGQPIENTSDFAGSFAEYIFLAYQHPQE
jgi:hypothetical protein